MAGLNPPGVDLYSSLSSYPQSHSHGSGYEVQQPDGAAYAHYQAVNVESVAASYYTDPNTGIPYVLSGTLPSNGSEQFLAATLNSALWTNPTIRPKGTWIKGPKKTKLVQSAWCEVCKLCCNSKDVLELHKLGKKHKKNLEKLNAASMPTQAPVASAGSKNPIIGPSENPAKIGCDVHKSKKKEANSIEDFQTKTRKVLEGGAAAASVRMCAICNVVCNSDTVFKHHLAGQKHIALMKKLASGI